MKDSRRFRIAASEADTNSGKERVPIRTPNNRPSDTLIILCNESAMTVLYTSGNRQSCETAFRRIISVELTMRCCAQRQSTMKVLLVHNKYRTSAPSGEDIAVDNERLMLESGGAEVVPFERCNDNLDDSSLAAKTAMAVNTIWSQRSRSELRTVLRDVRPDVVHVHNTFSMLSPSVYGACKAAGVPVVQTLHNFRFFCPSALFLRNGRPCEDCLDKGLMQSVRHRCYRGSLGATATLAAMLALHRAIGTYSRDIDRYITLTQFARRKAAKGGIEARKLSVKPNFVPNPPPPGRGGGGYVVFVGRLAEGKGTETLVSAWRHLSPAKLKIVGDGALRPKLEAAARRENLNIEFTGMQNRAQVLQLVSNAELLVVPSEWYEGFPMVIAESFACGTPVLAASIGSLEELVDEGVTGRKFTAADSKGLADAVRAMMADQPALRRMRENARAYFEAHLTEQANYASLVNIYADVIAERRRERHIKYATS
jgi:glycosyltransferase involved in cell wall biosynthesis